MLGTLLAASVSVMMIRGSIEVVGVSSVSLLQHDCYIGYGVNGRNMSLFFVCLTSMYPAIA